MSYQATKKQGGVLNEYCYVKKPIWKEYILCEFQLYGILGKDRNNISGCREFNIKERGMNKWSIRIFRVVRLFPMIPPWFTYDIVHLSELIVRRPGSPQQFIAWIPACNLKNDGTCLRSFTSQLSRWSERNTGAMLSSPAPCKGSPQGTQYNGIAETPCSRMRCPGQALLTR